MNIVKLRGGEHQADRRGRDRAGRRARADHRAQRRREVQRARRDLVGAGRGAVGAVARQFARARTRRVSRSTWVRLS